MLHFSCFCMPPRCRTVCTHTHTHDTIYATSLHGSLRGTCVFALDSAPRYRANVPLLVAARNNVVIGPFIFFPHFSSPAPSPLHLSSIDVTLCVAYVNRFKSTSDHLPMEIASGKRRRSNYVLSYELTFLSVQLY